MIRPILFNTQMVKAILDGRKTQTRRVVKGIEYLNVYRAEPADETLAQWDFYYGGCIADGGLLDAVKRINAPYAAGDVLWVREKFAQRVFHNHRGSMPFFAVYEAPEEAGGTMTINNVYGSENEPVPWTPSIHMPKEAARIFLRVKNVRVERLQDCGDGWCLDIEKEGVTSPHDPILYVNDDEFHEALRGEMKKLWDSTTNLTERDRYGWDANPWVWVIEFERCDKPEGWPSCYDKQ